MTATRARWLGLALVAAGVALVAWGANVEPSECFEAVDPSTGETYTVCSDFSGDWAVYLFVLGPIVALAGVLVMLPRRMR